MPLLEIIPSEKLVKMLPKEFKKTANGCRKGLKPAGRRKHQELCARVQELGNGEQGYELQQKELGKAIRNWFI